MKREDKLVSSSTEYHDLTRSIPLSEPATVSSRWRTTAVFLLKLCVGAAIVAWLVETKKLDIASYESLLSSSAIWLLVGIALTQVLSLNIVLTRWWVLLRTQEIDMPFTDAMILGYRGTFFSLFVPGALGTDGLRVLHLSRHFRSRLGVGLASVVLDRLVGFLGLVILAAIFCCWLSLLHTGGAVVNFLPWVLTVLFGTIIFFLIVCGILPIGRLAFVEKFRWTRAIRASFFAYREHTSSIALATGMTVVAHLLVSYGACLGLEAMRLPFSWLAVFAITPIITFIRFFPLTPLGLGVADIAGEELYAMLGLAGGAENQMLARLVWVAVLLVCGLAFFRRLQNRSLPPQHPSTAADSPVSNHSP